MQLKDGSRMPTLLGIDAKAFALLLPSLFHISLMMILFDILVIVFFTVLKVKRLEIGFAYRLFLGRFRGGIVNVRPWWVVKKWRSK